MEKEKSLFSIFGHLNPINRQEKEVSLAEESGRDEDAVIQIENLNIYIHNNHILKNVNLTLHDKKITCIIGPSGCGKTTLLRSINRMIDTTEHLRVEGRVLVSGEDIYDHKAEITHIRKKIGLLSQRPTPLPMSIYDNITYGCRIPRRAQPEGSRRNGRKILERRQSVGRSERPSAQSGVGTLHRPAAKAVFGTRSCRRTAIHSCRRIDLGSRSHIEQTYRRPLRQIARTLRNHHGNPYSTPSPAYRRLRGFHVYG